MSYSFYVIIFLVIIMIYLDYSATTPVNDEVLDSFTKACKMYPGNPNSLHKLGVDANNLITSSTNQILNILNIKDYDVIYTSGASESNNLALKGIADKYSNRGMHIITTNLEHSSINGPIEYLKDKGFKISYVNLDSDGKVDIDHLKNILDEETILVSINAINSELGIMQPIEDIAKLLLNYPKCYFHVDMTQAIGKINIDLSNVDLFSFSAHKFYGIKGIGALIKKKRIVIEPLIHGGKSTTVYRSGTPSLPLIVSMSKALRLSYENIDSKIKYITELNNDLREYLSKYELVTINSPEDSIPHILNISIIGVKPETLLHSLEEKNIYISTKSACSSSNSLSDAVLLTTKNEDAAKSSVRISLSHLTTKDDIEEFKKSFDNCYKELTCLR